MNNVLEDGFYPHKMCVNGRVYPHEMCNALVSVQGICYHCAGMRDYGAISRTKDRWCFDRMEI